MGIERVRLPPTPACLTIGSHHFNNIKTGLDQNASDLGTIRTGAFHANSGNVTKGVEQLNDPFISTCCGGEFLVRHWLPETIDHCNMMGLFMGIDSSDQSCGV